MMNPEQICPMNISIEDVKKKFQTGEVGKLYKEVRRSEEVEKYYKDMILEVKTESKKDFVKELLEDEDIINESEVKIQRKCLNTAFVMLIKDGGDLDDILVSCITPEILKEAIDELKEVYKESIRIYCEALYE